MNILITLPKDLLEKIISGEKKFEMRKCLRSEEHTSTPVTG